jgi:osmotically-inducible protein OsmY
MPRKNRSSLLAFLGDGTKIGIDSSANNFVWHFSGGYMRSNSNQNSRLNGDYQAQDFKHSGRDSRFSESSNSKDWDTQRSYGPTEYKSYQDSEYGYDGQTTGYGSYQKPSSEDSAYDQYRPSSHYNGSNSDRGQINGQSWNSEREGFPTPRADFGSASLNGKTSQQGRFSGMGPKGYKRSDERVHEDVCETLECDTHLDASNIEVEVKEGHVTLTGTVDNRMSKRHAEDCIAHLSGVKDVINNIRVDSLTSQSASSSASSLNSSNKKSAM